MGKIRLKGKVSKVVLYEKGNNISWTKLIIILSLLSLSLFFIFYGNEIK